jgi:hypothetical protein
MSTFTEKYFPSVTLVDVTETVRRIHSSMPHVIGHYSMNTQLYQGKPLGISHLFNVSNLFHEDSLNDIF